MPKRARPALVLVWSLVFALVLMGITASLTAGQREASSKADLEATRRTLAGKSGAALASAPSNAALAREMTRLRQDFEARDAERGLVFTLGGDALFDLSDGGRIAIKSEARPSLDRLAEFLNGYPERSIRIEGHTDGMGVGAANLALSLARAEAVRDAFLEQGIASLRLDTEGFGSDSPVATNGTAAGRRQNRRVEIVLLREGPSVADAAHAGE